MVGFQLEPEQEELRQYRRGLRPRGGPVIGDFYERDAFPYPVVAGMGQLGLFGLPFPEFTAAWAATPSRSAWPWRSWAGLIPRWPSRWRRPSAWAPCRGTVRLDEQRVMWLPDLCSGARLAAFGLTEAAAAPTSPAARAPGPARSWDGEWVIDGSKAFITNSGTDITSLVTVLAITGVTEGSTRNCPRLVPGHALSPGRAVLKGRLVCLGHRELSLTPPGPRQQSARARGRGSSQFLQILDEGRVAIAALATGLAQGCGDEFLRYAGERLAFGQEIGRYQAIRFTIADMEARAHTARLAWYNTAARMAAGGPDQQSSLAGCPG